MVVKGINAFGVGDCLQPAWRESLERQLVEREQGLYALDGAEAPLAAARFVLQTEVIITSPVSSGGRKGTHVGLLFPDFATVDRAIALLDRWGVHLNMGRPFIKCVDTAEVAERCFALVDSGPGVLLFPAHVLTPQGIYGSDHPVDHLAEVFGDFAPRIRVVETGLSADPELLAILPELDTRTLISNSDCHSEALNRVGREFTVLELKQLSYPGLVEALEAGQVAYTAEFNPAEGRYFLTGHRSGLERHGASYCYFSPDRSPAQGICPICGKPLTVGVLERALTLAKRQADPAPARVLGEVTARQAYRRLVPLVEVLAAGQGVKSVVGKKTARLFQTIIARTGTEAGLWELEAGEIARELAGVVEESVLKAILAVRNGDFSFQPGYDGSYGELRLGEAIDWQGQERIFRA
jgi:PHP family Zn ribbon phosphoesterase